MEHKVYLIEDYRSLTPDPAAIWLDICSMYGFINPGNYLQVSGHPDDGLVTFTYKVSTSLNNVKIQACTSRTFKIIAEEEEWSTGEILSPEPWGREEIWAQISSIRVLPHFSQFHFSYSAGEIPRTSRTLPPGHITVVRIRFPIEWRLELFTEEIVQEGLHAGMSVQQPWEQLHHQIPRLYPHATFNYAGMVQPNFIVTAEVLRELVTLTFSFEVKDNGGSNLRTTLT
jgi:hypothetical protein